jgi:hypothetical protein
MRHLFLFVGLLACACSNGSSSISNPDVAVAEGNQTSAIGKATLRPASELRFPAPVDCNSPAFWFRDHANGGELSLNMFFSEPHYVGADLFTIKKADGADLASLVARPARTTPITTGTSAFRWLEALSQDPDGVLYGYIHHEPPGLCAGVTTTKPQIEAVISRDGGESWQEAGTVLRDAGPIQCAVENKFFGGGYGDFSVIRVPDAFYFFFTSYSRDFRQQGISVARLPYGAHGAPEGKAMKWDGASFGSPGIDGAVKPIFPARADYGKDLFWGPSVHFNAHLGAWVMLMNHAYQVGADATFFHQEGIYISYSKDIANPTSWTTPVRLVLPRDVMSEQEIADGRAWYPQVIGLEKATGSDTYAGKTARFFLRGLSRWEIDFDRP